MFSTLGHCQFPKQITPQGYPQKVDSFTLDLLELQAQNCLKNGFEHEDLAASMRYCDLLHADFAKWSLK